MWDDEKIYLSSSYLIDHGEINRSASLSAVDTCQYNFLTTYAFIFHLKLYANSTIPIDLYKRKARFSLLYITY